MLRWGWGLRIGAREDGVVEGAVPAIVVMELVGVITRVGARERELG